MRALLLILLAAAVAAPGGALAQSEESEPFWETITLPEGPSNPIPRIFDIAMDGSAVWFSTEKDGIIGYDGGTWVLHTSAEGGLRHNQYRFHCPLSPALLFPFKSLITLFYKQVREST